MTTTLPQSCLIIGAGIAGLTAARLLTSRGVAVTVVDKGRGVGGRMATRRLPTDRGEARIDHGAQYFTARSEDFRRLAAEWLAEGVAVEWSRGFNTPAGPKLDHVPRYRGRNGMSDLPKYMAAGLDVHTATRIDAVRRTADGWSATSDAGATFSAAALIMTPPVPQSLALLAAGAVNLPLGGAARAAAHRLRALLRRARRT